MHIGDQSNNINQIDVIDIYATIATMTTRHDLQIHMEKTYPGSENKVQ